MAPRITIITPSYQQASYLEECLRSVHEQVGATVEHIVVDGGSTDGSAAVIRSWEPHLAWWCSGPDAGQSDALNKGLAHATGDVFGWINSDDRLLPGALSIVSERFASDPDLIILEGRRRLERPDGSFERSSLNDLTSSDALFVAPVINQQATFYRMDAVRAVGGIDPALRYCMDLDLWWRILLAYGPGQVRTTDHELAVFRLQPASKTAEGTRGFVRETAALLRAMAVAVGDTDMVSVLDSGYPDPPDLRASNARPGQAALVRRMIIRFLVKWNATIASEAGFRMMKRLSELMGGDTVPGGPDLEARWKAMRPGLRAPGWWWYRLGRKLGLWIA